MEKEGGPKKWHHKLTSFGNIWGSATLILPRLVLVEQVVMLMLSSRPIIGCPAFGKVLTGAAFGRKSGFSGLILYSICDDPRTPLSIPGYSYNIHANSSRVGRNIRGLALKRRN